MMGIDGALLLGVIPFPTIKVQSAKLMQGIIPAVIATGLGFAVSFGALAMSKSGGTPPPPQVPGPGPSPGSGTAQTDLTLDPCAVPPEQIAFPNFWYVKGDINTWAGQCWNQIDMFKLIRQWPEDIATGEKLIVLYRRDCDHCEEMFNRDFAGKITTPILAYHIPVDEPTWSLPPNHTAQLFELSNQTEWIVTTPLVVKLVNGKVECAAEGEGFESCLGVEPYDH